MGEFYREWIDAMADRSARFERTEEVKLEARLYDACLRFPTLKAKQNAVVTLECWAKQFGEDDSDESISR